MTDRRGGTRQATATHAASPWPKVVSDMERHADLAQDLARAQRSAADDKLRELATIRDRGQLPLARALNRIVVALYLALAGIAGRSLVGATVLYVFAVAGFGIWVGLWRGSLWWLGDLALLIAAARWGYLAYSRDPLDAPRSRWHPTRRTRGFLCAYACAIAVVTIVYRGAVAPVFLVGLPLMLLDTLLRLRPVVTDWRAARARLVPDQLARYVIAYEPNANGEVAGANASHVDTTADAELPTYVTEAGDAVALQVGEIIVRSAAKKSVAEIAYVDSAGVCASAGAVAMFPSSRLLSLWLQSARHVATGSLRKAARQARPAVPLYAEWRAMLEKASADEARSKELFDRAYAFLGVFLPPDVERAIWGPLILFAQRDPAARSGLLLVGPPGTGKTEIAKRTSRFLNCPMIQTSSAELKASVVGGTEAAIRELWQRAQRQAPCVVFIDEIDGVMPSRTAVEGADQFARNATESFLALWTGEASKDRVLVVGATNQQDRLDRAVLSRFGTPVVLPLPAPEARTEILRTYATQFGIDPTLAVALVDATTGLAGRDILELLRSARGTAAIDGRTVEAVDLDDALAKLRGRSSTRVRSSASWNTLVLPADMLERLQTKVTMLRNYETLQQQNIAPPRALLLSGPPGTGKTEIARTIANEARLHFEAVASADLKGQFQGTTAPKVRDVFERARAAAPSVVFIDEIDVIAPARSAGVESFAKELVGQLLQEMEGVEHDPRPVFVIGACNYPEQIDPAILSRFKDQIPIPVPDLAGRRRILEIRLQGKPISADALAVLELLAERTAGWTGRDLNGLVESAESSAVSRAVRTESMSAVEINIGDLLSALQQGRA